SMSDPDQTYRTKEDIQAYREQFDPIVLFGHVLEKEGILSESMMEAIDVKAKEEAEESAKFAEESPYPPVEDILKDIYWEEDNRGTKIAHGVLNFGRLPEQE
ncbi:MAG: pyruvate dehydrogenase (acetyl-transferring) E1 component subunit alpha, partial [Verrucomicrobia bacterium]